jgi:hypothetical protein
MSPGIGIVEGGTVEEVVVVNEPPAAVVVTPVVTGIETGSVGAGADTVTVV